MSSTSAVCVPCRVVVRTDSYGSSPRCSRCQNVMQIQGTRWRAPRRTDDKAWKLIADGVWNWDKNALTRDRWHSANRHLPTPLGRRPRAGRYGVTSEQARYESLQRGNRKSLIATELRMSMARRLKELRQRSS